MKTTDFTQTGGFPLSQDRLAYMQTSYKEALNNLARAGLVGSAPVKLWGMEFGPVVGGGGGYSTLIGSVSDGAFFYNGEIYQFNLTNYSAPIMSNVLLVVISTSTSNLTYNDGSVKPSIIDKTASLTIGASVTDATHFPLDSMVTFGEGLWDTQASSSPVLVADSTVYPLSGNAVHGFIYYRKLPMIDCLHIFFELSAATPGSLPTVSDRYKVATLPSAYRPGSDRYIPVACYHENIGLNDSGNADLRFAQFNIEHTSGDCYIDMSRHTGSTFERYLFNGYIPLFG